ncbi:Rho-related GTP-binding protein RhoU [Merluccius polli]|uniref:Rho-related GTP-binding protein RhoU n=1 Tax=Merluccius polli TaxID=89951 RepID=A0AA47M0V4_MERPO|nr:Rho-related GTP-binding protein RhoU [Merluccius polli]
MHTEPSAPCCEEEPRRFNPRTHRCADQKPSAEPWSPPDPGTQKHRRVSDPQVPPRRWRDRDLLPGNRDLLPRNRDLLPGDRDLLLPGRSGPAPERRVNCVLVGDGAVGKTSLVVSYTTNGYPAGLHPHRLGPLHRSYRNPVWLIVMVVVDGKPVRLQLCDMAGQVRLHLYHTRYNAVTSVTTPLLLSRGRYFCHNAVTVLLNRRPREAPPLVFTAGADVFLLCYSVVRPLLLPRPGPNAWVPEVRRHRPGAPLVLVGTQLDLREDVQVLIQLARDQEQPVGTDDGRRLAREIGAAGFTECSALTQKNLKDAFDSAILASVDQEEEEEEAEEEDEKKQQEEKLLWVRLQKKGPETIRGVSEAWWRKISCLVGEHAHDAK